MKAVAYLLFCLGAFICLVNFYLSFPRYLLHKWRNPAGTEYRWVSGFPLAGSGLVALSLVFLYKTFWAVAAGILFILLDTGGLPWYFGGLLYERFSRGREKA